MLIIDRHLDVKNKHFLDVEKVYNLSLFLTSYLAAPWSIFGQCQGGSFTNLILITAFDTYLTQSLISPGAL